MARRGAVAAGHPLTVQAAEEILLEGGNAYDAALAALLMACVAEPVLASLGGGGFLLARTADAGNILFDFFVQTPRRPGRASDLDFEPIEVDFGSTRQEFHIGYGAIATPGCVRGMAEIHRRLGSMPMTEIARPAVDAARTGVAVGEFQASIFAVVEPIYMRHASSRRCFESAERPGRVVGAGDRLRFPELADTLEVLAIEGADLFHRGEIARMIDSEARSGGGCLRYDDLAGYEVALRTPLETAYRGVNLFTNPPPSVGGSLVAFALDLLETERIAALRFGSAAHVVLLAEVMALTSAARVEAMAGAEHAAPDARALFDPERLARYRAEMAGRARAFRGTTHINTMDGAGNVASLTVSNGEGCGHIVGDTGIMLNNMLGEQDLNPLGFHRWRPATRLSSMMMPSIARFADGRLLATGSGGSNRIRTALLQLLVNVIDFGMDIEQAVTSPRLHYEEEVLYVEGGYRRDEMETLRARFPQQRFWEELNIFFGGAHSLMRTGGGAISGIGDPRRGGECRILG